MIVFYSYSHKDEKLLDRLESHLSALKRENVIESFYDRKISAGQDWENAIDTNLNAADVILLLISADFLASNFCCIEMQRALERQSLGTAHIIPVILRSCDWQATSIGKFQALPKDGKAITSWDNRDEAWTDVAKGIRQIVSDLSPSSSHRPGYKKLVVGCFDYPPFIERKLRRAQGKRPRQEARESEYSGPWFWAIVRLSEAIGMDFSFHPLSASAFADSASEYDIVPGLFKTAHREKDWDFSIPLHRIGLQGVCKAEQRKLSKELIRKGPFRIAVQRGEVGWEYANNEFRTAFEADRVHPIELMKTREMPDLLMGGKYDLAISDEVSCLHFIRAAHKKGAAFRLAFEGRLQIFDACIAVKKHLKWNIEDLNKRIRKIRNDDLFVRGEIRALRNFEYVERCSLD